MPAVVAQLSAVGLAPVDLDAAVIAEARRSGRDAAIGTMLRFAPDRIARHLVARSHERFLSLRDALVRNPDLAMAIIEAIRHASAGTPEIKRALTWMLDMIWKYELWQRGPGSGVLVLDEGFSHRSVTLFGHEYAADNGGFASLRRYIDAIPAPSLVIKIETNPALCFERAGVPHRFRQFDSEAQQQYLDSAAACVEDVAKLLVDRGVGLSVVDNNGSLQDARARLSDEVDAWVASL